MTTIVRRQTLTTAGSLHCPLAVKSPCENNNIKKKIFINVCRRPLSQILCDASDPSDCDVMNGLFNYLTDWNGFGECGAIKGEHWCAHGVDYVSGDDGTFYAYCARQV